MSGGTGWLRIHVWTAERTAVFSFSFNMPKKSDAATLPCICKSLLSIGQSSQTHRAFLYSCVTSPAPFHVLHADLRRSFMKGYRSPSPIFRLYEGIYEDAQKFFSKKRKRLMPLPSQAVNKMDILSTAFFVSCFVYIDLTIYQAKRWDILPRGLPPAS